MPLTLLEDSLRARLGRRAEHRRDLSVFSGGAFMRLCFLVAAVALLSTLFLFILPGDGVLAQPSVAMAQARQTAEPVRPRTLRFEVSVAPALSMGPQDGRLLIVLGPPGNAEPRLRIGETGMQALPLLGADAQGLAPGKVGVVDQTSTIFPLKHLSQLAPGEYVVQAVLHTNRDLNFANAPGDLYSAPRKVSLASAHGGTIKLDLTQQIPPEKLPPDTEYVKYLRLPSALLSRFHGHPMYLRAAVILPRDYEREPERHYPLRVEIGGYGTRFTRAGGLMSQGSFFRRFWLSDDAPRMLLLHLDGAGPYGDPYQVNSANNGPYGDAVTQELIPYVEKHFRGLGQPWSRFTDGGSTGGWVSLALQVFYPDFFNGAWSQCPDPVDLRAFELINIYEDENAYINRHGFERPSAREIDGDTIFTVRHECQVEIVLGRGNRWPLSGKDWGAWNAVFGPRGPDGLPSALWDGATGKIDRSVLEHWKKYDLRRVLQENWTTLGPKLHGKIHIWVGDADTYFLNNAVHFLDDFLTRADPPYGGRIVFAPRQGHTIGWNDRQVMREMAEAAKGPR
jgi:hypothetical protein